MFFPQCFPRPFSPGAVQQTRRLGYLQVRDGTLWDFSWSAWR